MNMSFLNGWPVEIDLTLRLLLAYFLGGIIGWDRERDGQAAGLRTHMVVAAGSAGFTLLFIFGFVGVGTGTDAARAASQIITGIGFLGAGAIWRTHSRVRGLTTAADLWAVAAIGMMAAVGMWYLACLLTFLIFITLRFVRPTEEALRARLLRKRKSSEISSVATSPMKAEKDNSKHSSGD
ncbi:MAG: MgtC/SapB family protein [Chloroflexota bacterium]